MMTVRINPKRLLDIFQQVLVVTRIVMFPMLADFVLDGVKNYEEKYRKGTIKNNARC